MTEHNKYITNIHFLNKINAEQATRTEQQRKKANIKQKQKTTLRT